MIGGGAISAISIPDPCYWKTKRAENRAQTFNATDANQAAGAEDHLFFKARSKARYCHRIIRESL